MSSFIGTLRASAGLRDKGEPIVQEEPEEIVVSVRAVDLLALMRVVSEAHELLQATDVSPTSSRQAATRLLQSALARLAYLKHGGPRYERFD